MAAFPFGFPLKPYNQSVPAPTQNDEPPSPRDVTLDFSTSPPDASISRLARDISRPGGAFTVLGLGVLVQSVGTVGTAAMQYLTEPQALARAREKRENKNDATRGHEQ